MKNNNFLTFLAASIFALLCLAGVAHGERLSGGLRGGSSLGISSPLSVDQTNTFTVDAGDIFARNTLMFGPGNPPNTTMDVFFLGNNGNTSLSLVNANLVLANQSSQTQLLFTNSTGSTIYGGARVDSSGNFNWHASGTQGHQFYSNITTGYFGAWSGTGLVSGGGAGQVATARVETLGVGTSTAPNLLIQDSAGTDKFAVLDNGNTFLDRCDSTGSPGATTCNKAAFRVAIAAAASSVVVTNSLISATSGVLCNLQTSGNATLTHLFAVVPGTGGVTINGNAAAAASAVNVYCEVKN